MNEIKKIEEKAITDVVFNRVQNLQANGAIDFPANYSVGNALKSAFLILKEAVTRDKKPVLQACSQESIANALLDMVIQGLNPAKQQCYFIPYGNQLQMIRSYLGEITLIKRVKGVKDVVAYPIYKNDELELGFDLLSGKQVIKKYNPSIIHNANDLIGALGLIIGDKEVLAIEYMDMLQIKNAWNQGTMKGNSPAHKNFPDQMAIKTVIKRICKKYVNTADDSDKIAELINRGMEETDNELAEEIEQNANKKELEIVGQVEIDDAVQKVEEISDISGMDEVTEEAPF
ncbi:hypothetical protein HMPREF3188_00671 [Tissierellia bacterium KA00581]|nr:hypothetical protein HMPREF3188_00671 [Tissierellia bacterium KA00581]